MTREVSRMHRKAKVAADRKLTGTIRLGDNPPVPIQEGRIRGDGDVITFKSSRPMTSDVHLEKHNG